MTSKVYTGDAGTELLLDTGTDISAASSVSIEARKPDGTEVSWTGSVSATTKVRYVSVAGTFDQAGTWRLQAKVTIGTGGWRGESVALRVFEKFT
jgi:hypothetical protein